MTTNHIIELRGLDELLHLLVDAGPAGARAMASALYAEGSAIMVTSQAQVPVRTGVLRSTGYVEPPTITGSSVTVILGYGGTASPQALGAAPYAEIVHEVMGARHDPPTKSKFLEDPVLAAAHSIEASITARVIDRLFPKTGV